MDLIGKVKLEKIDNINLVLLINYSHFTNNEV